MPADIYTMTDCASNYGIYRVASSSNDHHYYTVTFNGSEGPAFCTCKAFQYAPEDAKECKHIRVVWEQACMYNPQWRDGKENPTITPTNYTYDAFAEVKCICGGPMVYVRRAV